MILSNFCRFSKDMRLFKKKKKKKKKKKQTTEVSMENNLKYANFASFYSSIGTFSSVPGDAKHSENQV